MQAELCAPRVHRLLTLMVNVYFVEDEGGGWTLVDAGMPGYATAIRTTAERVFGGRPPTSIVLTHGHFDHVGGLPDLADEWGVPVYAHPLEIPYITGRSAYPPPDPVVGGGMSSWLSPLYPRGPIDLGGKALMLPADGTVPGLTGWRWLHTPGHTAGHVSLFRDSDRTLLAGDAFVTTRQESMSNVLVQREIVWRPPAYYTQDWEAAARSVRTLAALEPDIAATGHGRPLRGETMRRALHQLADQFASVTPRRGRYVRQPAIADEHGVVFVPPAVGPGPAAVALGVAAAVGLGLVALRRGGGRA
jgi:glyoxylase-like metal-dependent hydrolase (beta-lactamase superfamily II)